MIYGYIRVSTDKQTVENQRFEIEGFAKTRGMIVENWTIFLNLKLFILT